MKKFKFIILFIAGAIVFFGSGSLLWAQTPDIEVQLIFDKQAFPNGQPVGATVVVTNNSTRDVYISKGFSTRDFLAEMRVIDPAGRLILPISTGQHEEFPDAPPLPFCLKNNVPVQVASYEVLPAGWSKQLHTEDLRDYYPLKFPGRYSFQVQLPAMTWDSAQVVEECAGGDINDYESLGVFKSQTNYVYMAGSTRIIPVPNKWLINWKYQNLYPRPEISAIIVPEAGKTVDDYDLDHILLNNVKANRSYKQFSSAYNMYYIRAFFDRKDAINSLGRVAVNGRYPIVISGAMKSGGFFGGAAPVQIIKY